MRKFWTSVHGLRAFAAILVVIHHIPQYIRSHGTPNFPQFETGAFGVDIFFAISGFVMFSTTNSPSTSPTKFLRDRAIRILPLYWLITLILGATLLLAPGIFPTFSTDIPTLAKSLAFAPVYGERGYIRPLLAMGWTLHYEVFFYLLTAGFLYTLASPPINKALLASATIALGAIFIQLTGTDVRFSIAQLLAPISIEFLFGSAIGYAAKNTKFLDQPAQFRIPVTVLLLTTSIYLLSSLQLDNANVSLHRLFFWGIPGSFILISLLLNEEFISRFSQKKSKIYLLGSASYAIYLTHGISFSISNKIADFAHIANPLALSVLLISGALAIGILTHKYIEKSLQNWVSSFFEKK